MEEGMPEPELTETCVHCGDAWKTGARFCISCGKPHMLVVPLDHRPVERDQRDLFVVFGVVLIYILGSYLIDRSSYTEELILDLGFFGLVATTGWWFRSELAPAIRLSGINLRKAFFYLGWQTLITMAVVLSTNALSKALGHVASDPLWSYREAPMPLLFAVLSIGIAPAITEELAFRGLLFVKLIKLTSAPSAIIVSGFLFALVHFSFLSFFWLIPAGLFFGWVRAREGVIWYGVLCHFAHNTVVTVGEFYQWW